MKLGEIVSRLAIDPRKLTDYALNLNNPAGRDKAFMFREHLGFTPDNYELLLQQIATQALEAEVMLGQSDMVELLVEVPEMGLHPGSRGAIVECYADGKYEIEFSDSQGETLALQVLSPEQFSVVWQATTQRWLSVSEQLTILLERLSEERQQDVLQFARSLIGGN